MPENPGVLDHGCHDVGRVRVEDSEEVTALDLLSVVLQVPGAWKVVFHPCNGLGNGPEVLDTQLFPYGRRAVADFVLFVELLLPRPVVVNETQWALTLAW